MASKISNNALIKNNSETIGFVVSCLFSSAISISEFNDWVTDLIEKNISCHMIVAIDTHQRSDEFVFCCTNSHIFLLMQVPLCYFTQIANYVATGQKKTIVIMTKQIKNSSPGSMQHLEQEGSKNCTMFHNFGFAPEYIECT